MHEAFKKERIEFCKVPMYDTLSLAQTFIYFHDSFNLASLCDYYDIKRAIEQNPRILHL